LVAFLCGLLAYVIYGLNLHLCPRDRVSYPFATDIDGVRVPVQRDDVSVFGQLYPTNIMQSFFATQNLNLTADFKGMEIGAIFDGDTSNACVAYKNSLPACSITSPTGKFILYIYILLHLFTHIYSFRCDLVFKPLFIFK
jgi:chitin synthase